MDTPLKYAQYIVSLTRAATNDMGRINTRGNVERTRNQIERTIRREFPTADPHEIGAAVDEFVPLFE